MLCGEPLPKFWTGPPSSNGLQPPQNGGRAPPRGREAGRGAPCARSAGEGRRPRRLVTEWNERQSQRAPLLFSPTIGAAVAPQHWFLHVRCPGCCCTIGRPAAARSASRYDGDWLIPALSCRTCRPHAPFAELVKLSPRSIAGEMREERRKHVLGD